MKKIFTFILALVASVGISSAAITIRLNPSSCSSWSTVRLWAWTDEGNVFDSWPGQIVSKDGDGWYAYTFSSSITSVSIIWTNGTDQTVDITGVTSSICYKLNSQTGKAITVSVVDCSSEGGQGGTPVSGKYKIGDLYYNLNADTKTAEVTYKSYAYSRYNEGWNITTANIPASVTYSGTTYSVTSIGEWAFSECSSLTSVTIPNSVTSIGDWAFSDCIGMTSVTIPNSVTSIGDWAFRGCSRLTSVTIPNSVTSIGISAFDGCSGLTSVTIPNSVTSIGKYAFRDCSGLTSVTIGNSVTSIGDEAFRGCSGLTSVTIPNSVTSIGNYAFRDCSGLTSVTIPNSVTSIGDEAFRGCSNLTSVTIGNSVTSIGESAFEECSSLTSVTLNSNTIVGKDYENNSNIKSIFGKQVTEYILGDEITSIGKYAFYGCSGLTSVTIPNSVTSIGDEAFRGCSGLPVINNLRYADTYLIEAVDKTLSSYTIKNGTRWIGSSAFKGCSGLTSVTIPNSVTSIGDSAFCSCTGLTSVTIPNSVTSIRSNAFYNCSGLTSVTIPNSVTSIRSNAFYNCSGLTSVAIPNSVTSIGSYAFYNCSGLTSVTIPNSVTSIGSYAFYNCSSLTSVTLNSNTIVGKDYWNDYNLKSIFGKLVTEYILGDEITSIGKYAFYDCSGLTSVTIPNSVTSIGKRAFENCSSLTSVTIPYSVTSIGDYAFMDCSSLTSVTIGNSVTSIESYAFFGCNRLTSVYVPCGEMERFKQLLNNDSRVKYAPVPYTITITAENGSVIYPQTKCDDMLLTANPDYGYHFTKWSDGNTDNPRTFELTRDTTFTAEFAKNTYTISTTSANPEWGTTAGDKSALYLDKIEISATANYGYHFSQWNDGNTNNPRTVSVTEDKTYTARFVKNTYSITKIANNEQGSISGPMQGEYLDNISLTATPKYGYYFTQWSDSNTDNPRIFVLTRDTTFTAQFAPNQYTLSLQCDENQGTVEGAGVFDYLTEVQISATPAYGYHFSSWSDGNTANPRTITVTKDVALTANFAINKYALNVSCNAEQGSVTGSGSYNYLSNRTIEATSNYGYHFTKWSDGNTDNPRIIELRQDTFLVAIFAVDKYGTCGDNLQLTWRYDTGSQTLTISGDGDLTANMRYGVEAVKEMKELVIEDGVGVIGNEAFANIKSLNTITLGKDVRKLQERVFYNCYNLTAIYNYRKTPASATSNTFEEVDKYACTIYVMAGSEEMFRSATGWKDFYSILAIGATETTVSDNKVNVEPSDNSATVTWPVSNEAASYTIDITKDGVVFCRLTFNANGQLTGIAFAPGRDGQSMAPAAVMTANGLQFTVTGLNSNTQYGYNVTAKDANEQPIATYSGSFTTTSEGVPTGIGNTAVEQKTTKILHNSEVLILRSGKMYNLQGVEVK